MGPFTTIPSQYKYAYRWYLYSYTHVFSLVQLTQGSRKERNSSINARMMWYASLATEWHRCQPPALKNHEKHHDSGHAGMASRTQSTWIRNDSNVSGWHWAWHFKHIQLCGVQYFKQHNMWPLVICYIAIEHGPFRNSWFTLKTWWFSSVFCICLSEGNSLRDLPTRRGLNWPHDPS